MDLTEQLAMMEKMGRERVALMGSIGDLQTAFQNFVPPTDPEERERQLMALLQRFAGYLQMDEEHIKQLHAMLVDALTKLAEE